jgi:sec-independent protein translocase protein TatA
MVLAAGPFGLGAPELLIVLAIVILLFGATRIGDVMGSLGKGVKEFKKNVKEEEAEPEAAAPAAAPRAQAAVVNGDNGAAETVAAVKCPSCGTLNPVGARHCNQCGASIAAPVS